MNYLVPVYNEDGTVKMLPIKIEHKRGKRTRVTRKGKLCSLAIVLAPDKAVESFEVLLPCTEGLTISQMQSYMSMIRSFQGAVSWEMLKSGAYSEQCFVASEKGITSKHRVTFERDSFLKVRKFAKDKVIRVFNEKVKDWTIEPAVVAQ